MTTLYASERVMGKKTSKYKLMVLCGFRWLMAAVPVQ